MGEGMSTQFNIMLCGVEVSQEDSNACGWTDAGKHYPQDCRSKRFLPRRFDCDLDHVHLL